MQSVSIPKIITEEEGWCLKNFLGIVVNSDLRGTITLDTQWKFLVLTINDMPYTPSLISHNNQEYLAIGPFKQGLSLQEIKSMIAIFTQTITQLYPHLENLKIALFSKLYLG